MNKMYFSLLLMVAFAAGCAKNQTDVNATSATEPQAHPQATMQVDTALRAGVKLGTAAPGSLRETLKLYGSIQSDPDRVRQIGARYPGVVRSVFHQIGDRVSAGEKLATVESNESLQTYAVTTPLAGIITARHTNVGEVAGEAALFEVADYSQVRADLSVFPRDRARLKPGQTAHVGAADSTTAAEGKIVYIAPAGSNASQVIVARVALSNQDGRWSAGQFVTGEVVIDETQADVAIVPTALQQIKGEPAVFVRNGPRLEARKIEIGKRASNAVEIKSGLKAGEQYVIENSYLVKAELLKGEAEEE
jgi:membrane fusion protein, heavy metal efflux system